MKSELAYNSILIVFIGNIGTGKTTFIRKYLHNAIIVSRDYLRYMIGGGNYLFSLETEPIIFKIERLALEKFMEIGLNIIVDEVGINRKMRKVYVDLARKYDYKLWAIVMPKLSMKECVKRRMTNPHNQLDKKLWEQIWQKFDSEYEEPTFEEGFDKIVYIPREKVYGNKKITK